MARRLRHNEYTVAWICALPDELTAAHEMLDEVHQELPLSSIDMNTYKLGCIGKHNVVIVCPAPGQTDINAVAASARHLIVTFPAIRFGLMVGIGGGVPSKEADIRLGDVVVSQPGKGYSGVVQYNLEKSTLNSRFKCTGLLDSPPPILLTATAKLRSIQKQGRGSLLPHLLKLSNLDRFTYNKAGSDVLFEAEYTHIGGDNCVSCAATRQIQREERKNTTPMVHYGIIASGTQVIRNGAIRDQISSEFGEVLCFEMEAAGLTNNFPCLMIRGVCDYADSHKDKRWQAYAAGTAAAYAKELFLAIPTADVMKTQTIDKATRELGLKVVAEGVRPTVDVVAVHGLYGHRDKTWTAANGVHWLRDIFPSDIPTARILCWGYDANAHSNTYINYPYLYDHARSFVSHLCMERERANATRRPIIFVAHGLGGIIVKSALIHSYAAQKTALKDHRSIKLSTYGIIFMGTPHQGSDGVQFGKLLMNIASVFVAVDDCIDKYLERDSEWLQQQLSQYGLISRDFTTKFAFEEFLTPTKLGPLIIVVPRASAVVPGAAHTETIAMHADHINMVKFASKEDIGYRTVSSHLWIMTQDATAIVRSRWEEENRIDTDRGNHPFEEVWDVAQSEKPLTYEKWLRQLAKVPKPLFLKSLPDSKASFKVAIIDLESDLDSQEPIEPPPGLHIAEIESFSERGQMAQRYLSQRASVCANLTSRAAPEAKLFIARVQVVKSDGAALDPQIAQAISYIISEWRVDIISMSFFLGMDKGKVREAIQCASRHGILVFAAAFNRGNQPMSFPATAVGDGFTNMEEAIASLLLEDPVMKPLFNPSVARAGIATFRSHFTRLLRLHASRLRREVKTKLENEFANLIQKRAAIISNLVTNMIPLVNTEKSPKLAQLMETESIRTEISNRYIADTTSSPIEADDIEADDIDDVGDFGFDEDDAEVEEGDETAIDNIEAVKNFIRSTKPFQRLQEDICLFAFPDTRQLVRTTVDSLDLFHLDSDVMTVNCYARWELLACCKTEVEDLHNIAQIVTFTGNSKHAQAASCAEYLRQTWPKTGDDMMRAFRQAITKMFCDVDFSDKHRLKLQLEPAIDELERPESASVEITGSRSNIVETLEQLAWLAATFRKPQGGSMTSSYANLTRTPESLTPTETSPLLELTLLGPRAVSYKAGLPGNCWIPLLRESTLTCGFPISPRDTGLGLEIPVPLMMHLAGVHLPIEYNDQGIVFRSHIRPDPRDFSVLVPTQKLEKAIQWHFAETKTHQADPDDDNERSRFMNDMANSDSWYQTKDLDVLLNSRAFLGCWPHAKVLIGTGEFHSRTILDSGLPTTKPELLISTVGNVNVGGNVSAGIATILRFGTHFGIPFGYELRRGLRDRVPASQVGHPVVFRDAAQQPLLLYDSEAQRAWLVSELSVALDMTHHFLGSLDLALNIRTRLQYAAATGDGGAAAHAALDACRNEVLWEDGEKKIRFHHVVHIILSIFGVRKPAAEDHRLSSWNLTKPFASPRGWEYAQIRSLDSGVHRQRKANKYHKYNRSWWEITKNPTVLVLFGKGFEQVIEPDLNRSSDCPTWRIVPPLRGLLMASMPCLRKLSMDDHYTKLKASKLRWHCDEDSTLFEPCRPGRACVRIQELRKPSKFRKEGISHPPQDLLMPEGGVAFGKFPKGERHLPCPGPLAREEMSLPLNLMGFIIVMLTATLVGYLG